MREKHSKSIYKNPKNVSNNSCSPTSTTTNYFLPYWYIIFGLEIHEKRLHRRIIIRVLKKAQEQKQVDALTYMIGKSHMSYVLWISWTRIKSRSNWRLTETPYTYSGSKLNSGNLTGVCLSKIYTTKLTCFQPNTFYLTKHKLVYFILNVKKLIWNKLVYSCCKLPHQQLV